MDITLFLSLAGAVFAVIAANMGMISWIRSDMNKFESKMDNDRKCFETKIEGWKDEINKEMRDFHGRLCAIDERNRK